jgi:hypothetical protein
MKLFNMSTASHTITTTQGKVIRFPKQTWSEPLSQEELGSAEVQALLRKKVLRVDPLALLPENK